MAKIATDGSREELPVQPRTHTLIIGPSGGGKSFIAKALGARLGLPTLVINVSSWVVVSARNEPWTYSSICDWVDSLQSGGILVLDEIDKCQGNTDWKSYIRLESHDLLDDIIPLAARIPSTDMDERWGELSSQIPTLVDRESLARKLRERVFILGCGAHGTGWRVRRSNKRFPQVLACVSLKNSCSRHCWNRRTSPNPASAVTTYRICDSTAFARHARWSHHSRFRSVPGSGRLDARMKKLIFGKKTLRSIHLQVETILKPTEGGDVEILRVTPQRTDTGNFLFVQYSTAVDPQLKRIRYFATQRVGPCCDIWLETPANHCDQNNSAA